VELRVSLGALTKIMTALLRSGTGPSSLPGYAAALYLGLLTLVSALLVTLGRGHGWPRLPLAALLLLGARATSDAVGFSLMVLALSAAGLGFLAEGVRSVRCGTR
jgi:hypothetical protein